MSFVVSQEGAEMMWRNILGLAGGVGPFVHLLGTLYAPLHTSTLANFAANELPLAAGYAPQQLAGGGSWTITALAGGAQALSSVLSWTFTGMLTVYGYYLSNDASSISWGGEQLIPAYAFPAGGGLFTLQLPPYLISCPGVSAC